MRDGANGCVFCELQVTGAVKWVAQEAEAIAFLPLPADSLAPGHTLVVPRAHHLGVLDTPPATLATVIALVQRVGLAMQRALGATGVVVLNASGPHSGQSVGHLHFHVAPSWPDDGATFWPSERSRHQVEGPVHEAMAAALHSGT
jgi:histidine triad (HIT) family protein